MIATKSLILLLYLLTLSVLCTAEKRPIELKIIRDALSNSCSFLSIQETQLHKGLVNDQQVISQKSLFPSASSGSNPLERISLFSYDESALRSRARFFCGHEATWDFLVYDPSNGYKDSASTQHILNAPSENIPSLDIRPLVMSGSSNNRIDFMFFGDGYTNDEKDKFFGDAARLADDISKNQTFNTVKPLLNIWAAFAPSTESGIGIGGQPKNTTFGLYRDGTELRGVYYSKPDVARSMCASLGDQCDYPILMGNDPYYGGLGGDFTVITPSLLNGALVLRHELGHSIILVGEEYDGSDYQGYFGCNAASAPDKIGWTPWLTTPPTAEAPPRVERMVMSLQQYPWKILNSTYSAKFNSSGTYPQHLIQFSISGIPKSDQLTVLIDGNDLGWTAHDGVGTDRYFYEFWTLEGNGSSGFTDGEHEIKFVLNYPPPVEQGGSGPQLCNVEILEFGASHECNVTAGYYGIFPTFSDTNMTSYRPTNEDCLMRKVESPNFCKVCIEGLWTALMSRVNIIESAKARCALEEGRWKRAFKVHLLPLAQFRTNETQVDRVESYEIIWSRSRGKPFNLTAGEETTWDDDRFGGFDSVMEGEKEIFHRAENSTELVLDEVEDDIRSGDIISVEVRFITEEVRVDESGYLTGSGDWIVRTKCGS